MQYRSRYCDDPPPSGNGEACTGMSTEVCEDTISCPAEQTYTAFWRCRAKLLTFAFAGRLYHFCLLDEMVRNN